MSEQQIVVIVASFNPRYCSWYEQFSQMVWVADADGVEQPEDKAETAVGLFEMVDRSESDSMSSGASQPCPPPLTQEEWFTFLDSSGELAASSFFIHSPAYLNTS